MECQFVSVVTLGSATGRYGGPYDTALRQARIASENGAKAVLLAGYLDGDAPPPSTEGDGVTLKLAKVRRIFPSKAYTGLFSFEMLRELINAIRSADYVRVSTSRELIPMIALIVAALLSKPVVAQPHGMLTSRTSRLHKLIDVFLRPLVLRSAVIVSLTDVEQGDLKTWLGERTLPEMRVLGNPVPSDIGAHREKRTAGSDAVFVARLHPRKRVDVFVEASKISQSNGWQEIYAVVGPDDGDLHIVMETINSGKSALVYEGAVSAEEVTARVSRAGVFVLTSQAEPWGNVLAIALACGVPVVVTRSAALAGLIKNAEAGLIVEDGDAREVAHAVHLLLNDQELYHRTSKSALLLADSMLTDEGQRRSWMDIQQAALARRR